MLALLPLSARLAHERIGEADRMNITVFGANGRVGKLVVRRALRQGRQVQAFVRTNSPFDEHEHEQLGA